MGMEVAPRTPAAPAPIDAFGALPAADGPVIPAGPDANSRC